MTHFQVRKTKPEDRTKRDVVVSDRGIVWQLERAPGCSRPSSQDQTGALSLSSRGTLERVPPTWSLLGRTRLSRQSDGSSRCHFRSHLYCDTYLTFLTRRFLTAHRPTSAAMRKLRALLFHGVRDVEQNWHISSSSQTANS